MARICSTVTQGTKALCLALLLAVPGAWAIDNIRVVGLFSGKAVLEVDGRQRLLSVGQTSPEGVKLISANAREAVLVVGGVLLMHGPSPGG